MRVGDSDLPWVGERKVNLCSLWFMVPLLLLFWVQPLQGDVVLGPFSNISGGLLQPVAPQPSHEGSWKTLVVGGDFPRPGMSNGSNFASRTPPKLAWHYTHVPRASFVGHHPIRDDIGSVQGVLNGFDIAYFSNTNATVAVFFNTISQRLVLVFLV